jgi:predicted transcriptional regulator
MLIIWRAEKPVNADYILNIIKDTRDWKRTTLHTMLNRLISKGFLSCKKNYKNYLFSPIICEEDYKKAESKSILNKLFKIQSKFSGLFLQRQGNIGS